MNNLSSNFENNNVLSKDSTELHNDDSKTNCESNAPKVDSEFNTDSEDLSFTGTLLGVINNQNLEDILNVQNDVSESLSALALKCQSFQEFSQVKYHALFKRFETHTLTIKELQHDLEIIFRRISYLDLTGVFRALKSKIMAQFPNQYRQVKKILPDIVVEED